jgi:hypothetical protein
MAKIKRKQGRGGYTFVKELGGAPERQGLSKTARVLVEQGRIRGRVLDYGCGLGFDADQLGWDAFDPYYRPAEPAGPYDTIVVNHVVNILTRESRANLFARIDGLLADGSMAYVSTARNIPTAGKWGPRRRIQNYVVLELPSVYADEEEEIYALAKGTKLVDRTREFEETL